MQRATRSQPFPPQSLLRPDGACGRMKVVASSLLVEDGHVLLVREATGHEARCWNLPGGKAEPREPVVAAAVRETHEETGYHVDVDSLLGAYQYRHRSGDDRLRVVFWAEVVGGQPAPHPREIADLRWFALDQLDALPDRKLAKPPLLRAIFADLHAQRRLPLARLATLRPALVS